MVFAVTKTVDDQNPSISELVSYTLTVSNAGLSAASSVIIQDVLPTLTTGFFNEVGDNVAQVVTVCFHVFRQDAMNINISIVPLYKIRTNVSTAMNRGFTIPMQK